MKRGDSWDFPKGFRAKTDRNGRYAISYPSGDGDYWLEFRAIGFMAKRFEIKRIGSGSANSEQGATPYGSFSFNSLNDLQARGAATYDRTLVASERTGSQVTAAFSLGDFWRPKPDLQVPAWPRS